MSLKKFLYYLIKDDGRSAEVVNDVVTYSGQPKPLPQTPDGWQQILLAWERSIEKHGLITKFSLPLGFIRNGARIIRDALYKETIEAKLLLLIQKLELVLTPTTYNWVYKYFFRGELDMSQTEDELDIVNVPILESELTRLVKANEKTVYEFAMNDVRAVNVLMDGINLHLKLNYLILENTYTADSLIGVAFVDSEGTNLGIAGFTIAQQAIPGDLTTSLEYFLITTEAQTFRVYGKLMFSFNVLYTGIAPFFDVEIRSSLGNTTNLGTVTLPNPGTEINIDQTISGSAGEKFFLIINTSFFANILSGDLIFSESKLYIETKNRFKTTYIKAFKRFDLFKMLVGRITGNENYAISQLCQDFNNEVITCGDAVRGIETATLKTSLSDFFDDCNATFMAGLAIRPEGVEIEDRIRYYTEQDEIDLGNVIEFVKKPAIDLMNNTFKFGHQRQEIEDINGKYDQNGNNEFSGPLTKIVSTYEMVSPYKAGPYEIEILRINLEGKISTDDNSDPDVFVISTIGTDTLLANVSFIAALNAMAIADASKFAQGAKIKITGSANNDGIYDVFSVVFILVGSLVVFVQPVIDESSVDVTIEWLGGAIHTLNRPAYSTLQITSSFTEDTIFNLPYLTPKTMLLRHKRWIRSMNAGLDNQKIKFANGKENKNTDLLTVLSGVTIDEDRDESLSDFGDYIFLPWYFTFKTETPINLPELLEANPNRSFNFTDEYGQNWRGFLLMAGIAPNDYTPQEFKLLATPNNDIELLIHG